MDPGLNALGKLHVRACSPQLASEGWSSVSGDSLPNMTLKVCESEFGKLLGKSVDGILDPVPLS